MKWVKRLANTSKEQPLFIIALLLMWMKTYLVQKFMFELPVEGAYQELILLVSPISSSLLMLGVGIVFFGRRQQLAITVVSFISSFVLFANVVYYRFFNDFITLPVLMQSKNMGDLGGSITNLINPSDFLIFIDVVILYALFRGKPSWWKPLSRPKQISVFIVAIGFFFMNWTMAEVVRPELLTRTFDRQIVVKSIGAFNYHIYDLVVNSKMKTKKVFASSEDMMDAAKYLREQPKDVPSDEMYGIAKGKNVFLISMESLQSFALDARINGEEVTPFLNSLIRDSLYFENFYHQTGQGKTSDAEFIIDNSLYPLPSGAVYFTHAQNTYAATPSTLKKAGYYSAVFHANDKSFWNRDLMYQSLGYDRFFSLPDYTVTEENSIGWGLKDIEFFEQSVDLLKQVPQPFYSKFITLTNHHPFELADEDQFIAQAETNSQTVNKYFPTVRYMDEALKVLFEKVKEAGMYENSIFVLYGDHYGISSNHHKAMATFLGKEEITPFDQVQLQRVPLIIHIPGMSGKTISTVGGQVDVKPTLLHLLGLQAQHGIEFGQDLLSPNKQDFVVLRDGSFITKDAVFTGEKCYDKLTGMELEDSTACEPVKEKAASDLQYSDEIIYGDLLRFIIEPDEEDKGSDTEQDDSSKIEVQSELEVDSDIPSADIAQ